MSVCRSQLRRECGGSLIELSREERIRRLMRGGGADMVPREPGCCLRTQNSQARAGEPQGPPTRRWGRGCKQARFVLLINYNLPPSLKHRQHKRGGCVVIRGRIKISPNQSCASVGDSRARAHGKWHRWRILKSKAQVQHLRLLFQRNLNG